MTEKIAPNIPDSYPCSPERGKAGDGRALVKCHAGCAVDAICLTIGLCVLNLMSTGNTFPLPGGERQNSQPPSWPALESFDESNLSHFPHTP